MLRDLFSLFPAYAGVIPSRYYLVGNVNTFPRICGGDPFCLVSLGSLSQLFPAYAGVIPVG